MRVEIVTIVSNIRLKFTVIVYKRRDENDDDEKKERKKINKLTLYSIRFNIKANRICNNSRPDTMIKVNVG